MKKTRKVLIYSSNYAEPLFRRIVEDTMTYPRVFEVEVAGVVVSDNDGILLEAAKEMGIRYLRWGGNTYDEQGYGIMAKEFDHDFVVLCGWTKKIIGHNVATTINICLAPLTKFAGSGCYGKLLQKKVICSGLEQTAVVMQFTGKEYNSGPVFFSKPIIISSGDTPESLSVKMLHEAGSWAGHKLNEVIHGFCYYYNGRAFFRDDNPKGLWTKI